MLSLSLSLSPQLHAENKSNSIGDGIMKDEKAEEKPISYETS
jgi:hypothetical protein